MQISVCVVQHKVRISLCLQCSDFQAFVSHCHEVQERLQTLPNDLFAFRSHHDVLHLADEEVHALREGLIQSVLGRRCREEPALNVARYLAEGAICHPSHEVSIVAHLLIEVEDEVLVVRGPILKISTISELVPLIDVGKRSKKEPNRCHFIDGLEGMLANLNTSLCSGQILQGYGEHHGASDKHDSNDDKDHVEYELESLWSNIIVYLLGDSTED